MKPHHALFVAESAEARGKTLLGFVEWAPELRPHAPEVTNLFVHPAFQGNRVGEALFRQAVRYCGLDTPVSTYERNATARRFFEGQGCVEIDRAPAFSLDDVLAGYTGDPNWRITYVVPQDRIAALLG